VTSSRKRTKAAAKQWNSGTHSTFRRSLSGSITPHSQDTSPVILDDAPVALSEPARKAILQDLQQGVSDCAPGKHKPFGKDKATTSHHFPNARINESTADSLEQTTNMQYANGHGNNLRQFMRAGHERTEVDPISDDELGIDFPNDKAATVVKQRSSSTPLQTANSGAKRKSKAEKSSQTWPLNYARTHGYEGHGSADRVDGKPVLSLKPGSERSTWRIVAYDDVSGNFLTRARIEPKDIIKLQADDIGRMRLEGPRRQDGTWSIFDLEFMDTEDHRVFRDSHAAPLTSRGKPLDRDGSIMKTLFSKPLIKNDKVGTSPLVKDSNPVADGQHTEDHQSTKQPLWAQMKTGTQSPDLATATNVKNGETSIAPIARASARPARSTRSSAPSHDVSDVYTSREVEKYSINHGLGRRWLRPLTYSNEHQRASIYFEDLPRLDEEEFMNDSLIDFYMIYLFNHSKIPKDKVFFFNTHFFTRLTQNTGRANMNYKNVEKWTSKVDIFSYDYIVVPINEDTHWYLAIICNVGNIVRKPVQEDFDGSAVVEVVDSGIDQSKQIGITETETSLEVRLIDAPASSSFGKDLPDEQRDDHVNLFDEESELDLVKCEDTEIEKEERRVAGQDSSVPHSPQVDEKHEYRSIFDQDIAPQMVLSNLHASPGKKRSKRRSMGPKRDPTQPAIIILDSLSYTRSPTVRALKDWLAAEGEAKRGMEATIKEKGFYPKSEQIPTQNNFTDCGVYLLGYAEKFFQNPDEFKRKLLTGEMSATEDWPELKPKDMRNNLRNILFTLAQEQKLTEAKKKKKVKQATPAATKSSPRQPDVEPPKVEPQHPSNRKLENSKLDEMTGRLPDVTPAVHVEERQHNNLSVPRLASPFEPKEKRERASHDIPSSGATGRVIDSALEQTGIPSPQKQIQGRQTHPEVRVQVQTPLSPQLHKRHDAKLDLASSHQSQREIGSGSHSSTTSSKRMRQIADDNEEERTGPQKKQTITLVQSLPASLLLSQPQQGNSDHPIEIADSQDLKSATTQSPQRLDLGSPAQRKRSPKPSKIENTLRHAPSVEEVSGLPPRTTPRKHDQSGEKYIDNLLEASLDADDEAREAANGRKPRFSKSNPASTKLERAEEFVPDIMDVDSQGMDLMDTAEDGVVRETPEPARRSPPLDASWVSGQPLPH
jgi:sentrin-specific protease 7